MAFATAPAKAKRSDYPDGRAGEAEFQRALSREGGQLWLHEEQKKKKAEAAAIVKAKEGAARDAAKAGNIVSIGAKQFRTPARADYPEGAGGDASYRDAAVKFNKAIAKAQAEERKAFRDAKSKVLMAQMDAKQKARDAEKAYLEKNKGQFDKWANAYDVPKK